MPFSRVVEIAADPKRHLTHHRAWAERQKASELPIISESVFALRLVAEHLGTDRTNRRIYWSGRASLIRTTPKRRRRDLQRSLPTDDAIYAAYGSFPKAAEAAGLIHDDGREARRGMPLVDAVEAFLCDVGCLPWSIHALAEYGEQRDVSIELIKELPAARDAFVASWRARGHWTPERPPRKRDRPPLAVDPRPDPRYPRSCSPAVG
jgi:hypothetical protein